MDGTVFETLLDVLAYRASLSPHGTAFTYEGQAVTYSELWLRVRQFARLLLRQGIPPGSNVIVALPNGPDFFTAFYGAQLAGSTAVPLFPASDPARILAIAAGCNAACLVVPAERLPDPASQPGSGLPAFSPSQARDGSPDGDFPRLAPADISFIQYTSGSTGEPKGVMLSHASLLKNIQQMIGGMQITEQDIFVSWLPVYHDMGLILMTMVPFYLGIVTHLLPADLRDVRRWLKTIEARRGTFTAAPDFAYRLCLRHISEPLDLSSLRVALNAAEPVRAQTLRDFESRFGLQGVMTAGYGLAEATVGVSMSKPGKNPTVDARGFVSVGCPFPEVEIRILEDDLALPAGEIGEVAIRTLARCTGYYNAPEETRQLFTGDGFLLSGDLGFVDEAGQLYIVGRRKNTIKHAGETIAPRELEEIVDAAPGVRFSAAVGIDRGRLEGEQVYVFAEVQPGLEPARCEQTVMDVVESLHGRLGFRPARVLLLKPRAIPRTHNGKIQHLLLREQYLSGQLRRQGLVVFPEA